MKAELRIWKNIQNTYELPTDDGDENLENINNVPKLTS